jgi:hypothetical protein
LTEALSAPGTPGHFELYGCDTADMLFVHNLFRSVYGDAPMLVRGVADGDVARAWIVSDHLFEIGERLHDHHQTQDDELWGRLEQRDPGCTTQVARMKAAHARITELLAQLSAALHEWRVGASPADREAVLAVTDDLLRTLKDHLADEEATILPIAARTMTQVEWDRMGELARAKVPSDRLAVHLGFLLASMPEAERDRWKKDFLPASARLAYDLVGRHQYEKQRKLVYGDAA